MGLASVLTNSEVTLRVRDMAGGSADARVRQRSPCHALPRRRDVAHPRSKEVMLAGRPADVRGALPLWEEDAMVAAALVSSTRGCGAQRVVLLGWNRLLGAGCMRHRLPRTLFPLVSGIFPCTDVGTVTSVGWGVHGYFGTSAGSRPGRTAPVPWQPSVPCLSTACAVAAIHQRSPGSHAPRPLHRPMSAPSIHAEPPPAVVSDPEGLQYATGPQLGKGGFAICHRAKLLSHDHLGSSTVALKIVKSRMEPPKLAQKVPATTLTDASLVLTSVVCHGTANPLKARPSQHRRVLPRLLL